MLSPKNVFETLQAQGIDFFTGVPDSLLRSFCAYIMDHAKPGAHVITANEGNAIALASGYFLGTGRPALVYMQNSGFCNAINPLTSLADPGVYGIPMLLMVGWRGFPEIPDQPQHAKLGRLMPRLLDVLEYPWWVLAANTPDLEVLIGKVCREMYKRMTPVVLIVKPGTFEPYEPQRSRSTGLSLNRETAIKIIVDLLDTNTMIVSTTGKISRELYEYREVKGDQHARDFLTVGSMGHAASIAMGVAAAQHRRRIVCLDGDGSVLMHMGSLAVIGQSGLANLLHIVLNNGAHDSVGGQPTAAFDISLTDVARACGYRRALCVADGPRLIVALRKLMKLSGPTFLEVRVNTGARSNLARPKTSPIENRDAFMRELGVCGRRSSGES